MAQTALAVVLEVPERSPRQIAVAAVQEEPVGPERSRLQTEVLVVDLVDLEVPAAALERSQSQIALVAEQEVVAAPDLVGDHSLALAAVLEDIELVLVQILDPLAAAEGAELEVPEAVAVLVVEHMAINCLVKLEIAQLESAHPLIQHRLNQDH